MAGFFDSLGDTLGNMLGEPREGETDDQFADRKMPFVGSKLYHAGQYANELMGNIPQDALNASQQAYEYATHPVETAKSVGRAAMHPIDTASNIYQHYADQYGSVPKFVESLKERPVSTALDWMPAAGLASAPLKGGLAAARSGAGAAAESARGLSSRLAGTMDELAAAREARMQPSRVAGDREFGPSPATIDGSATRLLEAPRSVVELPPSEGGDPFFGVRRSDRTKEWRNRVFDEPRLNPLSPTMAEERAAIAASREAAPVQEKPALPAPKSETPSRSVPAGPQSYWERIGGLPEKTRNDLLTLLETGKMPPAFRMNAIRPALRGRDLSLSDIMNETEGTMSPYVYNAHMKSALSGKPMSAIEQNAANAQMQTFRPVTDADIGTNRSVRSPLSSAMNDPDLQFSSSVNKNINDRYAADAEAAERFARLPPVLQTNALYAKANRLLNNADEVHDMWASRARPSARVVAPDAVALGMEDAAAYKPKFEPAPETAPSKGGLSEGMRRILGRVPSEPMALGAVNALYSPKDQPNQPQKYALPDMDILKHKPATGPTMEEGPMVAKTEKEKSKPTTTVSRPEPKKAAPKHRAETHRAAPARRAAPSQLYYGDYRDVDPFTNDPIGRAIDELTGNTAKTSKRKGTIGDLGFANGGMARKHYEDGGSEDRVPVLSDIGDALGGLFGGGDQQRVVAQDKQAAPSGGDADNFFERWQNNPLSQFLFSAGLGTMASDRVNPLQAIGEGGLRGLEYMQAAQANQRVLREEQRARAAELADQKILEKIFSGGDETTAPETTVPAKKTAAATPEVPETPVIAPAKVTEAAPPAAEGVPAITPATAPEAKPETAPAAVKQAAAPAAEEPIVAKDDRLESLTAQYNKIQKVLPFVRSPATLQKLRIAESGLKEQINQIRQDRKDAAAARKEAGRDKIAQENLELSRQRAEEYLHPEKGAFARKSAEELAKDFSETQKAAPTLPGQIKQIEGIIDAVEHGKVYHSEQALKAAKFFQGLGLDMPIEKLGWAISALGSDPEKIANTQNLARLGVKDLLQQIGGSLGQGISEGDRRTIMEAALGVDKDPASNLHALKVLKQAMAYQAKRALWQREYVDKVGYLDAGYNSYEAQKAKENPIFGEEPKTGQTSSAPKTMSREEKIAELRRRQQGQQ